MKFRNLTQNEIEQLNARSYPNYPEYMLLDLPGAEPKGFYRGASEEELHIEEAAVWQQFILDHYLPPDTSKLLLLHQCSWAKPYDMSATLEPVVKICNRFDFVHRVIVSNVGLVPSELQMNPVFCSYDWIPPDGRESTRVRVKFFELYAERLDRYLSTFSDGYYGILAIAARQQGSKLGITVKIAEQYGLPVFSVPDQTGWDKALKTTVRDPGNRIRHPVILEQLEAKLIEIQHTLRNIGLD